MWSSAQPERSLKLLDVLARKGGHGEERVKQDRVLGVPNVGETEKGRRFSSEDKLGGGGEGGGCGEERSDSGIFRRWN